MCCPAVVAMQDICEIIAMKFTQQLRRAPSKRELIEVAARMEFRGNFGRIPN